MKDRGSSNVEAPTAKITKIDNLGMVTIKFSEDLRLPKNY